MQRRPTLALAAITLATLTLLAQNRMNFPLVSPDSGHVALGLALRKLAVSGTFMQVAAHPDDEHNALFALFTHGMGLRSISLQTTRGEGGQNEIGPELFHDMGVLRTSELLSAHRLDGAEQYFTRAIDFGYSFSPDEVIEKWGRKEIIGDFVRLIRTLRPDVLLTMNIQGRGGDRAHEATTVLTREAWKIAGDPSQYPEQIREGLRPWQPRKLYFTGGFGGPGAPGGGRGGAPPKSAPKAAPKAEQPAPKLARPDTSRYDPLLARTYAEIASDSRSNHKCQGMGGLPPLPGISGGGRGGGGRGGGYQLVANTLNLPVQDETSLFNGIDISLASIARFAGPNPTPDLVDALDTITQHARRAQQAFDAGNDAATAAPIEAGLAAVRALRAKIRNLPVDAQYEIDFRLKQKERDFEDAVLAAHGVTFEAIADDGLVVPGQPIKLSLGAMNRGTSEITVTSVNINGFDAPAACPTGPVKKDTAYSCAVEAKVPATAALTTPYFTDDYWSHPANHAINNYAPGVDFGIPFAPTPFRVTFRIKAGDVEVTREAPFQYRYIKDIYTGDKRMELNVVPAFSVRVTPPLAVIASAAKPVMREVHVTVTNSNKGKAEANVAIELPAGWKATPPSVPIRFEHEDESLSARFQVTAPPQAKAGAYTLRATVTSSATHDAKFSNGYQEIDYPHVQRRQVIKPAETTLKVVDVKTTPNLAVGFIVGAGDQVPAALEQLGAKVTYIDADELAWGDLNKYSVIMTGVRAYEARKDLRAYNQRLLDYAAQGGTVIVQYNKMEFNQANYGPFPAKVSGNRVCDETVPVKVLTPDNPVFTTPNKIGPTTWDNWVQERGLYFLGDKDKKYVDLVAMTDSFKDNPGEKRGALVEAQIGKGRWIYLGLALWRQLPAGTDGAYQLMANLISLGKR
jgi:LmbE family N-acetylglucosaminyl deacetylase